MKSHVRKNRPNFSKPALRPVARPLPIAEVVAIRDGYEFYQGEAIGRYLVGEYLPSGRFWVQWEGYRALALEGLHRTKNSGKDNEEYKIVDTLHQALNQLETVASFRPITRHRLVLE